MIPFLPCVDSAQGPTKCSSGFVNQFKRMYDSRPSVMKHSYFGLCPRGSRPEDTVTIFAGARVPYVVRPRADGQSWMLVIEANVHGIMDGAVMVTNPSYCNILMA
jgi:hypothetical protein